MANRLSGLRTAIFVCAAVFAADAGAADKCPLEPGRWRGAFTGEYVAARFEKEPLAYRLFLGVVMDLDVRCDGQVTGTFTHKSAVYDAFSAGSPAKTGKCDIAFDYRIIKGKAETGPYGTPVLTLTAVITGHPPKCSGEITSIARRWAAMPSNVSTFVFTASTAAPRMGMFGSGSIPWDEEYNFVFRFGEDGFQKAKNFLWFMSRAGANE